jgi:hypothetical protein
MQTWDWLSRNPLVVTSGGLIVQIDMEELAGIPGLSNSVHKVESRHLFMGDFGIHPPTISG